MADEFMSYGNRPMGEAWVQYILEYPMPTLEDEKQVKESIIHMLKPVMNVASRSNLKRREIPLHLWEYDIIWQKYFVYKRKGKYNPDLLVLKESLREGFDLQLNRSVEAGQMRMIFEPKQSVLQKIFSSSDRKLGFFKRKQPEQPDMDGEI